MRKYIILGIDLAAKEKNPTGICYDDKKLITSILYSDEEILNLVYKINPAIIVFDSPLSIEEPYRKAERELIRRGYKPLPLNIKSMKELYNRAIGLINKIREKLGEVIIIETFPRAVEKIIGFDYNKFKKYFRTKHEYDAWLCFIVGKLYLFGYYEEIYEIVLPLVKKV